MLVVHFCEEILGQERTRSDDRPFDQRHYPCKILCIHFCAEILGPERTTSSYDRPSDQRRYLRKIFCFSTVAVVALLLYA